MMPTIDVNEIEMGMAEEMVMAARLRAIVIMMAMVMATVSTDKKVGLQLVSIHQKTSSIHSEEIFRGDKSWHRDGEREGLRQVDANHF